MEEVITVEHAVNAFCDLIEELAQTDREFDESDLYAALKRYAKQDTAKLNEINSQMLSAILHQSDHIRYLESMNMVKRI